MTLAPPPFCVCMLEHGEWAELGSVRESHARGTSSHACVNCPCHMPLCVNYFNPRGHGKGAEPKGGE